MQVQPEELQLQFRSRIMANMTRRNEVIKVAGEIDKLRSKLSELERRLDNLLGEGGVAVDAVNGRTGRRNSYARKILEVVDEDPGRVFSEEELMEAGEISDDRKSSFRSALSRLVKTNQLTRHHQKHYQSVEGC